MSRVVRTAWNDELEVEPREFIGAQVYLRGVHELAVCETLWRLAEPGERVVDVGANIGVMTSVLSKRVGRSGRVFAFEPHPRLFDRLRRNAHRWNRHNVQPLNWAVSDHTGTSRLLETAGFAENTGTAALSPVSGDARSFEVRTVRLDHALPSGHYGVLKIDVEGHEQKALTALGLAHARFRDVVFESRDRSAPLVNRSLASLGYHVFGIHSSFWGPNLFKVDPIGSADISTADYLATQQPQRAIKLLAPRGWKVLWSTQTREENDGNTAVNGGDLRQVKSESLRFGGSA